MPKNGGATIAQWIRLRLPSCRPGFESQAHHLSFYQFIFELYHVEKDENKQKEAGIGPFFLKKKKRFLQIFLALIGMTSNVNNTMCVPGGGT